MSFFIKVKYCLSICDEKFTDFDNINTVLVGLMLTVSRSCFYARWLLSKTAVLRIEFIN